MNVVTRPVFHQAPEGFVLIATKEGSGHFQFVLRSVWGHNLEV